MAIDDGLANVRVDNAKRIIGRTESEEQVLDSRVFDTAWREAQTTQVGVSQFSIRVVGCVSRIIDIEVVTATCGRVTMDGEHRVDTVQAVRATANVSNFRFRATADANHVRFRAAVDRRRHASPDTFDVDGVYFSQRIDGKRVVTKRATYVNDIDCYRPVTGNGNDINLRQNLLSSLSDNLETDQGTRFRRKINYIRVVRTINNYVVNCRTAAQGERHLVKQ